MTADPATPEKYREPQRHRRTLFLLGGAALVVIGAVGGVILLGRNSTPPASSAGPPVSVTGSPNPASCNVRDDGFLEAELLISPAADLYGVRPVSAAYLVDYSPAVPEINVAGRIAGSPPPGMSLWLLAHPLRDSTGLDGSEGSDRFYPAGEIALIGECWHIPGQSIGYSSAEGIIFEQQLVLVSDVAEADFSDVERWHESDGFGHDYMRANGVQVLARFSVPTKR